MPFIGYLFFAMGPTGPLFVFGILAIFSCIASFLIPKDTTNINLDTYHEM